MRKLLVALLFTSALYSQQQVKPTNEQYYFLRKVNETYKQIIVPEKLTHYKSGLTTRYEYAVLPSDTTAYQYDGAYYTYYPELNKISYVIKQMNNVQVGDIYLVDGQLYNSFFTVIDNKKKHSLYIDKKQVL